MITVHNKVRIGTTWFKSGHFYQFYYTNYANDPVPVIVMLNYVNGIHPRTGNKHNYIQGINLTYIARSYRRMFVENWIPTLERNKGNILLTWRMIIKQFPYLRFAMRRYLADYGMMRYQREIKNEDMEKVVVSTFSRDFSMSAMKTALKLRAGKKGGNNRLNVANKSLSQNRWFKGII